MIRPSTRVNENRARIQSTPSSAFVPYEKNKNVIEELIKTKNKVNLCIIL